MLGCLGDSARGGRGRGDSDSVALRCPASGGFDRNHASLAGDQLGPLLAPLLFQRLDAREQAAPPNNLLLTPLVLGQPPTAEDVGAVPHLPASGRLAAD